MSFIKRIFSVLVVIFILILFPLSVSAAPVLVVGNRKIISENFNDTILVYSDGQYGSPDDYFDSAFPFYLFYGPWYNPSFSDEVSDKFDVFLGIILNSAGYNKIDLENIYFFSEIADLYFDDSDKVAISNFVDLIGSSGVLNGASTNVIYVGFSKEFVDKIMLSFQQFLLEKSLEPSEYILELGIIDVDSDIWYMTDSANVVVLGSILRPGIDEDAGVLVTSFRIQSASDYMSNNSFSFQTLFQRIANSIDINIFTSWLPDIIAAPIITHWGIFFTICLVLVVLKTLHG